MPLRAGQASARSASGSVSHAQTTRQSTSGGRDRAVETLLGGELALASGETHVARRLHPHRVPTHRHARRELRTLVIGPQAFARIEQPVVEVAARVEPADRRFGDVDRYRAALAPSRAPTPRSFGSEFAFDEFALH